VGTYGPGDLRFLKLFKSIKHGRFVMIGSGRTLFHTVYIDDMVEGLLLAGRKERAIGQVFTIAGENYLPLQDLVNLIADTLGVRRPWLKIPYQPVFLLSVACDRVCRPLGIPPPIYPRRVAFFAKNRAFSIEKAKRLLGYHPTVSLPEGIRRTKDWYEQQGLL
jgi:nucleoside-diphosphate-sugar epimerase